MCLRKKINGNTVSTMENYEENVTQQTFTIVNHVGDIGERVNENEAMKMNSIFSLFCVSTTKATPFFKPFFLPFHYFFHTCASHLKCLFRNMNE